MATAGGLISPPVHIKEEHGLTQVHIHCDVELSEGQLGRINSRFQDAGLPPVQSKRRQLRWATQGEGGGLWGYRIELCTILGKEKDSLLLHILMVGDKAVHTEPTAYRRSQRTVERIRTVVDALSQEHIRADVDCSITWHSSSDSWLLPRVLPLNPSFPEKSVIQEISGVIGGSADGAVQFVVDRAKTDPMLFHIWLAFKHELAISPTVMVEATAQGAAMLEDINVWRDDPWSRQ